jgi:hypothetical protein
MSNNYKGKPRNGDNQDRRKSRPGSKSGNWKKSVRVKDTTATNLPDVISSSDATTYVNISTSPLSEVFNKTAYQHNHNYHFNPAIGNLFAAFLVDDYEPFGHYANDLQIDIEVMFYDRLVALGNKSVRALTIPSFTDLRLYFQAVFGAMRYIYVYDALRAMVYSERYKDYNGSIIIPQEYNYYINDLNLDLYSAQELMMRYKQLLVTNHALPPMWQSMAAYLSSPFTLGNNHRFAWYHAPRGVQLTDFATYTTSIDAQIAAADALIDVGTFIRQVLDWAIEWSEIKMLYDDTNKAFLVENYPVRDDQLRSADFFTPSYVQTYGGTISEFQLAFLPLHNAAGGHEGFAGQETDLTDRGTKNGPGSWYFYSANEMSSKVVNPGLGISQVLFKDRIPMAVTPEQVSNAARSISRAMLQYNTLNELLTVVDGNLVRERRYRTSRDGKIESIGQLSITN